MNRHTVGLHHERPRKGGQVNSNTGELYHERPHKGGPMNRHTESYTMNGHTGVAR